MNSKSSMMSSISNKVLHLHSEWQVLKFSQHGCRVINIKFRTFQLFAEKAAAKTAFHYSSQVQTWSKTWSQAGRKHVKSRLRTCLKRFFSTFHLSSTRTNQRTCCASRPGYRQKKVESVSKAYRKPAQTCRKPGRKLGLQPGL